MTIRIRVHLTLLAAAVVIATGWDRRPEPPPTSALQNAALTQTMPVDPQITPGKLPNGLALLHPRQQKAREARRAAARRQCRLDPRRRRPAGARALRRAHGVQRHEALSEAGRSSSSWSRSACGSARDLNAYTSFDETVYMLQVPTDKPRSLDRSLLILETGRTTSSFDPAEIDKERGVVLEEWRLGAAPARGCRTACFPCC